VFFSFQLLLMLYVLDQDFMRQVIQKAILKVVMLIISLQYSSCLKSLLLFFDPPLLLLHVTNQLEIEYQNL